MSMSARMIRPVRRPRTCSAPYSEVQVVFNRPHLVGVAHGAHAQRGPGRGGFPTVHDLPGDLVACSVGLLQVRSVEVEVVEDEVGRLSRWLSEP